MLCNDLEAQTYAKLLISGYPNSALIEPEYYISQVVTVFREFEVETVKKAISPAGIPFDIKGFLPTIGQVYDWLTQKQDLLNRLKNTAALPKLTYRYEEKAAPAEPQLFVPCCVEGYDLMVKRAKEEGKGFRYQQGYISQSWPEPVDGIWVMKDWWDERDMRGVRHKVHGITLRQMEMNRSKIKKAPVRKEYTEAEKAQFLEDAKKVGASFSGMKLRPETLQAVKEQDELRDKLIGE